MHMNKTITTTRRHHAEIRFGIRLDWLEKKRGLVTADDVQDTIHVATPTIFGGEGQEWSPEHLFISAIAGSFMTTYLYFAGKLGFSVSHFICDAKGTIALSAGKYAFTHIDIYPKIYIEEEVLRKQAQIALEKAADYCMVCNAIKAAFSCHGEIIRDPHPKYA